MKEKEMLAELNAAKRATNRKSIVTFGFEDRNQESVFYTTKSGKTKIFKFKFAFNANKFYRWIDEFEG